MIESPSTARHVYVLGAGFSKAISDAMPVTNELGLVLKERLAGVVDFDIREGQSFEDWLTLQITPLPFLEGFANSSRAANAARVIAEIANVLDERVEKASETESRLWLRQLVALWSAERAVVLTFNYDTLLERAVNASMLVTGGASGNLQRLRGDHVVFPAPPATQPQSMGDSEAPHNAESLQVLKLHGSLAWYWAAGDASGSTLVRVREKRVFGPAGPPGLEMDFSGATTLDRYLIPPVTSKDGYYGSYLANSLWRSARALVASAASLTLVGYSLPLEDRVASQLIAEVGRSATIRVVDREPGQADSYDGILGRLASLGIEAEADTRGQSCVQDFVSAKLSAAIAAVDGAPAFDELEASSSDVVVAIANTWPSPHPASYFVLLWNEEDQSFDAYPVHPSYMAGSVMPYRESILNAMPPGMHQLGDFVTAARLRELIADARPFLFKHPNSGERLVAIGADRIKIERWELLQLKWAPAGP